MDGIVKSANGGCYNCGNPPSFMAIVPGTLNKYLHCSQCIKTFEDKPYWTIEPMKPEKHSETPVIPDLVCKIKWNETSKTGGMTCLTQGECSGKWFIATKKNTTPSLEFDYEDYKCFPVCEKHKGIFHTSVLTPLEEVIGAKSPDYGQKPGIPAMEIPEFCEYCSKSSPTPPNPPAFLCKTKNSGITRFLCKKCLDLNPLFEDGTITPLGEDSGMKNEILPSFEWPKMCAIEHADVAGEVGGSETWQKCEGKPEFIVKNSTKTEFTDTLVWKYPGPIPVCKKHIHIWDNAKWEIKTISEVYGVQKMDKIVPSFSSYQEHKDFKGNAWYCEQEDVTGWDGTTNHFGECYELNDGADYACDNHAKTFVDGGSLVKSYGSSDAKKRIYLKPPSIPDCLLPYLNSPENGQVESVKKYDMHDEHYEAMHNYYICDQIDVIGFDGTKKHFGECYGLKTQKGGLKFACDNHAGVFVTDGYLVSRYGNLGNYGGVKDVEPAAIPDCLKPYIPGTIENCWFNLHGALNFDYGVKWGNSGPCDGPQAGWMSKEAVCKAHWSFITEMNKKGHFTTVEPLEKVQKMDKKPVKKKTPPPAPYTVRTQKAKGLQALKDTYFPVPSFQIFDVKKTNPDELVGKFVRPCPMRPRHGFVDSRTVKTREDAEKIITETLAADPEAEFLLMDYVPAPFSGIWTPGYLAIGTGTDGATAGKTAITIPIMGDYLAYGGYSASAKSKAGIESAPYVEILWRKMSQEYQGLTVQLRDGPKLPEGAEDYIPSEFTVEHVILADGDLLEWEEKMRHTAPNSVVWHPNGTMASHYAIHAVLNKVPLLITREPKIGEKLKPTENGPGEVNIDLIRAGFAMACEQEISMPEAAYFMLLGCHQTGQWLGKFDILLGASMGFAYRLAMTAALGEERHYDKSSSTGSRDAVYKKYWQKADSQTGRTKFLDALEKFLNGHLWPGSNYGGKAWYQFTSQAVIMYNSLIRKDHKTAMEAMNVLINAAHNSGWGFNKFISQSEMTQTAKNPIYSGFKVGPSLYQILTATNETVKSAARSFWKRKELVLPVDKGTGMGKLKSPISGHDEDEDDEDEHEECDESCLECHPKPPHIYSEFCGCDICKKTLWQMGASQPQVVTKAHVKVVSNKKGTDSIAHIQYKSESCEGGPHYYIKDIIPAPKPILDMYKAHIGKFDTSYAGSETPYIVMGKDSQGWGVLDLKTLEYHKLLDLEVTPNAS